MTNQTKVLRERERERERERDPGDPATQLVTEPALDVFTFILKLVSDQTCWNLAKLTLYVTESISEVLMLSTSFFLS